MALGASPSHSSPKRLAAAVLSASRASGSAVASCRSTDMPPERCDTAAAAPPRRRGHHLGGVGAAAPLKETKGRVSRPLTEAGWAEPGPEGAQNDDPGVCRNAASSAVDTRPSTALRWG